MCFSYEELEKQSLQDLSIPMSLSKKEFRSKKFTKIYTSYKSYVQSKRRRLALDIYTPCVIFAQIILAEESLDSDPLHDLV